MNTKLARRIFEVVYPLFTYYIMYYCLQLFFASLFIDSFGSLFCLCLAAICCIPVQYRFYRKVNIIRSVEPLEGRQWLICIGWIIGIVLLGVACNLAVSRLPLAEVSEGYETTSQILNDGSLFLKILTNACLVPVLEELLYRGIICGQIEAWGGVSPSKWEENPMLHRGCIIAAVVVSALIFGALHMNVVQFLYAGFLGLFLGAAYVSTHRLWVVIAAHGLTNLMVILATSL